MKVWRKDIGKTDLIQNLLEKNTEDCRIQKLSAFFWGGWGWNWRSIWHGFMNRPNPIVFRLERRRRRSSSSMRCLILDAYSYLPWLMILIQFIDANRYLIYFRCVPDFRCQQKRQSFSGKFHAHFLWEVARAIPLGSRSIYIRYTMARLDEVRKNLDGLAKPVGLLGFPLKL